jgi:hypothetical protein
MKALAKLLTLLMVISGCAAGRTQADNPPQGHICAMNTCFRDTKPVRRQNLFLRGMAFMERSFLQVYSIALYTPRWVKSEKDMLSREVPKSIEIEFERDMDIRALVNDLEEILPAAAEDPELQAGLTEVAKAIMPIERKKRYEFRYEPGKGTQVFQNGDPKTTVQGDRFAEIFFNYWLQRHNNGNQLLRMPEPLIR